jgi:drug/metabolite transporter (DMT)-like permease
LTTPTLEAPPPPRTESATWWSGRRLALGEAFLAAVLEASSYVAIKMGQQDMSPLTMAALRNVLTFAALLPVILVRNEHRQLATLGDRRRLVAGLAVMGLLGYGLSSFTIFSAISGLSAVTAGLLQAFRPLLAMLLGLLMLRDQPSRWQIIGVGVILAGAYIFFPASISPAEVVSVALMLAGYAMMVVCQVIGRGLGLARVGVFTIAGVPFGIGAVVLGGVLLATEGLPQLSSRAALVMAWLSVVCSAAGFVLIYHALKRLTNVEHSSIANLVPLTTAVLAAIVLNEALAPNMLVGLVIATAGVFIVQWRPAA